MQRLLLLKNYATHFQECFASIDHYMVRAFMKGIGDHNAMLFENRAPLDPLLNKIAMFQAGRAGIEMSKAGIDITGCSVEVQVRLPGKSYYEPLMGLPSVEPRFEGELSFGLGSKPIPVAGEYTRQVFVLPTESDGSAASRPDFRIMAETEYKNTPVVVVIGTPDGKSTAAKAVFLLVDTWAMRMALEISAIPSNKTFAKAMCLLPPEMASFAKAIRACDMAEGGLDLHVIYLRPLLASALDIDEDDLKGDPDWMTQLVGLMRGGVSLQSIAQGQGQGQGQARRSGADDAEGFVNVGAPKYDLALMKTQTAKLEQQMWKQGEKDHYKPPEPQRPPPEPMPRYRSMSAAPCYRSMGAASYEAEEPRYNACSASAPARASAPPAADRSAPPAPPPAGARRRAGRCARRRVGRGDRRQPEGPGARRPRLHGHPAQARRAEPPQLGRSLAPRSRSPTAPTTATLPRARCRTTRRRRTTLRPATTRRGSCARTSTPRRRRSGACSPRTPRSASPCRRRASPSSACSSSGRPISSPVS